MMPKSLGDVRLYKRGVRALLALFFCAMHSIVEYAKCLAQKKFTHIKMFRICSRILGSK